MLTRVDDREEAQEVLRHMLTSSMMRQDISRNQLLLFGLICKSPSLFAFCLADRGLFSVRSVLRRL